jgi:hypothetical protein
MMQFIDGLWDNIKSSVLLHHPSTLDTACALSQLQEEVLEPTRLDVRKPIYAWGSTPLQHTKSLPRPPPTEKPLLDVSKRPHTRRTCSMNDKHSSLKAYFG